MLTCEPYWREEYRVYECTHHYSLWVLAITPQGLSFTRATTDYPYSRLRHPSHFSISRKGSPQRLQFFYGMVFSEFYWPCPLSSSVIPLYIL